MSRTIPHHEREKHQRARTELVEQLRREGIANEQVLRIIEYAPRHCFIESALWHHAYKNSPLPIQAKQTISQPYMVAHMTELVIENSPQRDKILEIGTGSGYQAYILAQLFERVYTVERIESLHLSAREKLKQLDCINCWCKLDDGQSGWQDYGLYPAIMVTAAIEQIPQALKSQLDDGGILVAPIGKSNEVQTLTLIRRNGDDFEQQQLQSVRFVPVVPGISQ